VVGVAPPLEKNFAMSSKNPVIPPSLEPVCKAVLETGPKNPIKKSRVYNFRFFGSNQKNHYFNTIIPTTAAPINNPVGPTALIISWKA